MSVTAAVMTREELASPLPLSRTTTASHTSSLDRAENREALALWHRVTVETVRESRADLSARQLALLLHIQLKSGQHTVRSLAQDLAISKPAICRALDALSVQGLLMRKIDPKDRRNVFAELTEQGQEYLSQFSERIMRNLMDLQ